ncbi:MAG TPA: HAD-IIB family hydrolase [Dissulfurispiraceae bacterium]|nr:HAD-IIB family hydrolase [Dissulfurispiraceae bacterium]
MRHVLRPFIIFTDLDGTLVDSKYSFRAALPALHNLKERRIPLILCSSKTRSELQLYRKRLGNSDPFITENGGGIFIPNGYFSADIVGFVDKSFEETHGYQLLRLGARYEDLRHLVRAMRAEGYELKGFGDMSVADLVELTGLSLKEAALAKKREFDEPFIAGDACGINPVLRRIEEAGFHVATGRFHHIVGDSDKGKAVSMLIELYKKHFGNITTAAVGDSPNDLAMLERVDYPVIVMKDDGTYDSTLDSQGMIKAEGIGPAGWNKEILRLLSEI